MNSQATKALLDLIIATHGEEMDIGDDASVAVGKMDADRYVLKFSQSQGDRTEGVAMVVPAAALAAIGTLYNQLKDGEGAAMEQNAPASAEVH